MNTQLNTAAKKSNVFIMKLIIAGGRNYRLTQADLNRLYEIKDQVSEVVCGCCTGADRDGEAWAKRNGIPVKMFSAKWGQMGAKAGPIRNANMARYAEAVALFPGGKGTESMYREAVKHKLIIFDWRK